MITQTFPLEFEGSVHQTFVQRCPLQNARAGRPGSPRQCHLEIGRSIMHSVAMSWITSATPSCNRGTGTSMRCVNWSLSSCNGKTSTGRENVDPASWTDSRRQTCFAALLSLCTCRGAITASVMRGVLLSKGRRHNSSNNVCA